MSNSMTSSAVTVPLAQVETPLLAVALAQGNAVPAALTELDRAAGGVIARAVTSGDFKGKRDETALLYPSGGKAERLLLVGMGKPGDVTRTSVRRAAAVAAKRARALGAKDVAAGQRVGDAVAAGHRLTRYLQMQPGNVCTPSYLADRAKQLADAYGFAVTVLDRAALTKEGMGAP